MTRDELSELDPELLFLSEPEYDEALVGVIEAFGGELRAAYNREKLLDIIARNIGGLDAQEQAEEHFSFNILGSYMGPRTPVYLIT